MIRTRLVAIAVTVPVLLSACGSPPTGHGGAAPQHGTPVPPGTATGASEALRNAEGAAASGTPVEQALVGALARRIRRRRCRARSGYAG